MTGQPDFAHLVIDYVPGEWLVEFEIPEALSGASAITARFMRIARSHRKRSRRGDRAGWLRIGGYWYPRGGMPIDLFWQTGKPPEGLWLPDQGVAPYRGRG